MAVDLDRWFGQELETLCPSLVSLLRECARRGADPRDVLEYVDQMGGELLPGLVRSWLAVNLPEWVGESA